MTHTPSPWILTGAIGTGKSTLGSLLAARGARVIDADRIGHAVIEPDGAAFAAVAASWPEVVDGGRIDRSALGRIVFADGDALESLERITHPLIIERLEAFVEAGRDAITVFEVSVPHLALDPGWPRIVVVAPPDIRRERLEDRGMTVDEIRARMSAQPPAEEWARPGDLIVDNEGSLDDLHHRVAELWARISNV